MALITAKTIITSISLFHLTLAYFFLTSPSTIDDQALCYFIGESMAMPYARGFDTPSQPLAFLAVVLAGIGLGDLVSLSMPEEVGMIYYWGTQAPIRSIFSLILVLLTALTTNSPATLLTSPSSRRRFSPSGPNASSPSGPLAGLKNRLFFTFMFVEMITWFWIWVTLREERDGLVEKLERSVARGNVQSGGNRTSSKRED